LEEVMMRFALLVAAFVLAFAGSLLAQDDAPWNQTMCPNGVEAAMGKLPTFNPYDTEGRCFRFMGRSIQLLDRSQGLFSFMSSDSPFALVDFGKSSAPVNFYSGVVLSKGAYSYVTVTGTKKIVFSFVNVPKSEKAPSK
jgi:hypothetical protein